MKQVKSKIHLLTFRFTAIHCIAESIDSLGLSVGLCKFVQQGPALVNLCQMTKGKAALN